MMNFLKQVLRIGLAIGIGYPLVQYLEKGGVMATVIYFGVYVGVSLGIEGILQLFSKAKGNNDK